jgi:hypothetical protein
MKNNIETVSLTKKTTPKARDLYQVAPSQEYWEIDGAKGHQNENSQSSVSEKDKTQNDARIEA